MSVLTRLVYAVFLTIALVMPIVLLGAVMGWTLALLDYPATFPILVAVAFVAAPMVERMIPLKRRK